MTPRAAATILRAMAVLDDILSELEALERAGLLRRPLVVEGPRGAEVTIDGRSVLLFCSNDYLGLAADPRLLAATHSALDEFGVGATASRLIAGTSAAHTRAERALATLVGLPAALLFSSGYAANTGALSALLGRGDVVFSDRLNHASLIDGIRLSRATVHVFDHADADHLEHLLRAHRREGRRAWVVTDTVFSMDGDLAPLRRLRALCDAYDAGLYVDEAHAIGVLGEGRGLAAQLGVRPDALVGTLGKSAGLAGAFVASAPELRAYLENRARSYIFSTALPPFLAAVVETAVRTVEQAHDARERLRMHATRIRAALHAQGWAVPIEGVAPIIPVTVGDPARAMELSAKLLDRGIFVQGIRPPTVPPGTSRLRLVPTAAHTHEHVDRLIAAFAELAAEAAS